MSFSKNFFEVFQMTSPTKVSVSSEIFGPMNPTFLPKSFSKSQERPFGMEITKIKSW
jgi:hypothetical protein